MIHQWIPKPLLLLLIIAILSDLQESKAASFCSKEDQCAVDEEVKQIALPAPIQARYDYTRIYQVELASDEHVRIFQALELASDSCSFMGHARVVGQKLTIMVTAAKVADFDDLVHSYNVTHRVLNHNFQSLIDANYREVAPPGTTPDQFDWKRYYPLENIYAWLESLAKKRSDVVSLVDLGASTQGLPIKGVRIAFGKENLTSVFVESGIHAREWIAPATATYFIDQLLNSEDPAIQELARSQNWLIFPTVNPDGYRYTFEGDRMWRKNRALFGICRGVDLNRNFPFHWNVTGASGDPCRYDYSGPSAGSELETQRIVQFLEQHIQSDRIRTFIALHSYSQMIMFPYGHSAKRVDNYQDLTEIGQLAAQRIKDLSGRIYKSGSIYETIYPSAGGSKDWAHGHLKIPITFSYELRGPADSEDLFILSAKEIEPTAGEAFASLQTIVQEAGKRGYYQ
ncbi:zinc carboxypeptidase [Drosophila rhopaloa]|uniref:Peptidase M14 domain-containing protein n=1 Tax=Drosophila rhopaloa TaxID=1041015 RepID=A0ABM5I2U2_DRORH|nr:zinc carboxypeptidase [Drosophila rhopaloa]